MRKKSKNDESTRSERAVSALESIAKTMAVESAARSANERRMLTMIAPFLKKVTAKL